MHNKHPIKAIEKMNIQEIIDDNKLCFESRKKILAELLSKKKLSDDVEWDNNAYE